MDVSPDERTLAVWLSSELDAAEASLRAWRRRELGEEPAPHRDGNFVDAAQQTMVTETRSADAARLADRVRCLARAFDRLRDGRYGRCEKCDEAISPSRLRAIPLAERCLACQHALELSLVYRGEEAGHRRRPGGRSPRATRPVRPDRRPLALAG
jgi:RNA polymerase-binding transcription factor DksA